MQKAGGALARALNENEEKRRARVARGIAAHGTRVKDAAVGRDERREKGNEGWRAFLNKGWDAVAMAPHGNSQNPQNSASAAASILNSVPTPNYTSTCTLTATSSSVPNYARTNSGNSIGGGSADASELSSSENER